MQKAEALDAELKNPRSDLRALSEIFKRIANITKGVTASEVDATVLTAPAEIALHEAFNASAAAAQTSGKSGGGFPAAIREYVKLRPAVDQFFADVMVMVDDPALRSARLALLVRLRDAIQQNIGDLTQLGATSTT
jgi:glycyl-tRNA synthetase beta subunit